MSYILIAMDGTFTNMVSLLDSLYLEMLQIHQMKDSKIPLKVTRQRLMIECGDFIIDIRPATHEKLAGIKYDYFLTNSIEASEYLSYHYKGYKQVFELYDTADIIKIFIEYLEVRKDEI